jgi:hypothetical protein
MIDVSLSQIVLICFAFGLLLVSATWLITVTRVRQAEKKQLKDVITCRICGVRYEAEPAATGPCPACGTPNELDPPNTI